MYQLIVVKCEEETEGKKSVPVERQARLYVLMMLRGDGGGTWRRAVFGECGAAVMGNQMQDGEVWRFTV